MGKQDHAPETLLADRVVYFKSGCPDGHVAFVIKVHSAHLANLIYYCPNRHAWFEATSIQFGQSDSSDYFVNPEG